MTFRRKITVSFLLYIVLCGTAYAQVVEIPDPNLRQAVREALNLPAGAPITQTDTRQLTGLSASESQITDLTGLEYAANLTNLVLGSNYISDLAPLAKSTKLELLWLWNNPLSDLSPLANLTHLEKVDFAGCQISDITPLSNLTQLTTLILRHNRINDLTPLAGLIKLEDLSLWSNPVFNLTPLTGLTNLKSADLSECQISDITPLSNLTQVTTLSLRKNHIVDVSPLANLTQLNRLYLQRNWIVDVSPIVGLTNLGVLDIRTNPIMNLSLLEGLSLTEFLYDEHCELPALPVRDRIHDRKYPSIFARWSGVGGVPISNRPDLSAIENVARHDLWFSGVEKFGLEFKQTVDGFTVAGILHDAIRQRNEFLAINPNMVFLATIGMRSYSFDEFPEDWPYWIRDADGNLAPIEDAQGNVVHYGLVDFTHPVIQDRIVQQAIAVAKCGLYDGIMFDYWVEDGSILNGYREVVAEQRARDNILRSIREATGPDFLIMGNTNQRKIPRTGVHINGGFMETGVPESTTGTDLEILLNMTEDALLWLDTNLREPRINGLEGFSIPGEPLDSPNNLRWMRVLTTLSLTHSDGYVLYSESMVFTHYWYDFWDADLGRPVGPKTQLYDTDLPGLYIREFTNGWAVYNHSGAPQIINLPEETRGVASGQINTTHLLPNLDGEMYLKKTAPIDNPDVNGSGIYIAEPIDAVPGAVLHLDASNNPGPTARWNNLGTAGGTLIAWDRLPLLEEGEIEIPSIGFSGRRRYYTATASRHAFGGPVHTNPKLYLGDWTLEFLCKRNGNLFAQEHQFAGFQNSPREGIQGIRLRFLIDGQELELSIHADGFKQPTRALNIFLEENVWTWVTIVSKNGESIIAYQDGIEVSRHPGVQFDANLPLDDISIGANSFDERRRNFNGSFSIVRVYDRALTPDEVLQNIGATVIPITNPADVNGDGVVNILDLLVVAQGLGSDKPEVDVNGDGVVNVFDLVFVAGAIGGGGAAPSAFSLDPSIISAADVERWLTDAQGLGVGDANFQRGIRFLEGLLSALTPKETTLLPNYPNPFNPETWIPYRLAREAEVAITIYDTKGSLVRRLALGNQAAGHYAERGKAAYWDGRNEEGEAVVSGIYIYQFRAGDYAASRRMVIVK